MSMNLPKIEDTCWYPELPTCSEKMEYKRGSSTKNTSAKSNTKQNITYMEAEMTLSQELFVANLDHWRGKINTSNLNIHTIKKSLQSTSAVKLRKLL